MIRISALKPRDLVQSLVQMKPDDSGHHDDPTTKDDPIVDSVPASPADPSINEDPIIDLDPTKLENRRRAASADLIPLRALNQACYCPRLYFLQYVDSVMPINEYVEDGIFQHRRVDDPELELRTRKDGDVFHTRSVSLSSESLGLTGKLDLIEERGDEIVPIEYKRSSWPTGQEGRIGYWENDAIQLCGQALLLEEHLGKRVDRGVIYYKGSKSRVDVPIDESLREKTRATIELIRKLDASDTPPEPLPAELRHRCHGCSLVTICLPEETLFLTRIKPSEPAVRTDQTPIIPKNETAIPLVLPDLDDGAVLYVQEQGAYIGKRSEHLVISRKSEEILRAPIASIRQVVLFGNIQISTQALTTLAQLEIPVVFLTIYGKFIATLNPAPTKNVSLRAQQYRAFTDQSQALELSKRVVAAKISNQRTLLMRSLRARNASAGSADSSDESTLRASDDPAARGMFEMLAKVERADSLASLLGIEGQAAALYFGSFNRMIKQPEIGAPFDFQSRNRRPPRDPVNALLSFAYAILAKDCFSTVCSVGFDPYQGFYHAGRHGRPSLALDLMEEFRSVIADSVVLTLINNGLVTARDFVIWRDACQLSDEGRKRFFQTYEQRKAAEATHPVFGYKLSLSRTIEVQARLLASYVRGDSPRYIGYTAR